MNKIYKPFGKRGRTTIPQISSFLDEEGTDRMEEIIRENYYRIKSDVEQIVKTEIMRIEADPELSKLLQTKKK